MFHFVSRIAAFVCITKLLFAGGPAPSLSPRALVIGGPAVTVSGTVVSGSLAAFVGEEIETHDEHTADLQVPSSLIKLQGHTKVRFKGSSLDLLQGAVIVKSENQFTVTSSCFNIRPTSAKTRYTITPYQGRIYVSAEDGKIELTTGTKTRTIQNQWVAISGCGTRAVDVQEVAGNDFVAMKVLAPAAAAATTTAIILPKQSTSSKCPTATCP